MKSILKKQPLRKTSRHSGAIHLHYSERVLTITFEHEPTRNSLNEERSFELLAVIKKLHEGDQPLWNGRPVGVLVLESAIKGVFLSGGDLTEIMKHPKAAWQTMKNMREVAELMSKLPCLSIVILAGKAVGGGAELALACDERWIASDDAALELRQRDWGLPAGWNGLQNLLRIRPAGGIRRARLDFVMGRKWSVEDLLSDGLAQQDFRIAPVTRQKALAAEQAARICACPPRLRVALLRDSHVEVQPAMSSMSSFLFEKFWLAADHLAALKKHQAALRRHRTTQDPDDVKRR